MTTQDMREYVSSMYPGSWPERVALMKANQVQAIFVKNFNRDGSPKPKQNTKKTQNKKYTQITVWDILNRKAGAINEENNTTDV